jgi:dTDP-4-dehydrorhamnose 3,5-epimerase
MKNASTVSDYVLKGATKDEQGITADWEIIQDLIHGVAFREVKNVPKFSGMLTEVFRRDWNLESGSIDQVFQVCLMPGSISEWHMHMNTTDRIFVNQGMIQIVLYDGRKNSATFGYINEFKLGVYRPGLVVIPAGVWHAVQNIVNETSCLLNLVDEAYQYENPDHWRLPINSKEIPYTFDKQSAF